MKHPNITKIYTTENGEELEIYVEYRSRSYSYHYSINVTDPDIGQYIYIINSATVTKTAYTSILHRLYELCVKEFGKLTIKPESATTYAIDYDGTLVEDMYTGLGKFNTVLVDYVKLHQELGDTMILWTCRCGDRLEEAIRRCRNEVGLEFDYINSNCDFAIQKFGDDPRKIFAHHYIDDKAGYKFGTEPLPF